MQNIQLKKITPEHEYPNATNKLETGRFGIHSVKIVVQRSGAELTHRFLEQRNQISLAKKKIQPRIEQKKSN